jgi:hypothetical protein
MAHGSCFGNAHLHLIDVRTRLLDLSSEATDRSVNNPVGAEVNVSERDGVALERLEVTQVSISASEYTHMRPREGQAVSKLLCFLY